MGRGRIRIASHWLRTDLLQRQRPLLLDQSLQALVLGLAPTIRAANAFGHQALPGAVHVDGGAGRGAIVPGTGRHYGGRQALIVAVLIVLGAAEPAKRRPRRPPFAAGDILAFGGPAMQRGHFAAGA